jgi:RNA 3'-terminal phosphate cyclase
LTKTGAWWQTTAEGYVRKVRGVAYCAKTSPNMAKRITDGAK